MYFKLSIICPLTLCCVSSLYLSHFAELQFIFLIMKRGNNFDVIISWCVLGFVIGVFKGALGDYYYYYLGFCWFIFHLM